MSGNTELRPSELFQAEIGKCIECGTCLHSCPVYRECLDEAYSPRGRNRLIKKLGYAERMFADDQLSTIFQKCLLCGRCASGCPRGVQSDLMVLRAREELIRRHGLGLAKKLAFRKLMANPSAMKRAVRLAGRFQWFLPRTEVKGALDQAAPLRHLPLLFMGLNGGCEIPEIPAKFLSESVAEVNPPAGKVEGRNLRVAYFAGCATEYLLPGVGEAVIRLLNDLGVEVVFPKDQGCCGIAVQANGDAETARLMALRNLDILARLDVQLVVTGCATCGSTLKEGWANMFRGHPRQADFQALGKKVRDFSELLVLLSDCKPLPVLSTLPPGTRVTYHDPCHLARYQGVVEQPRRILNQVFGTDFVEMEHKGCCGCGGSFSLHSRDLSQRIGEEKLAAVEKTGAQVVVNTCPGCMIQLASGIGKHHLPQQVLHLAEVIRRG
jgi:glycolate oxidase iron-sulfur subunit